ncbi:hypothetical protein BDQ94DRAFT_83616 [Aspergillus welwitschiae]|uniref:Uncharacterized protein n=1 Tax=Aspergillus welwitschiae TaxID=1341132 RepID=A0A3F3PRQ3_9EURO|nr:hypothetical protein BDQ94DRAFT_83616 [Aspergillus welwitschiae]RDH29498.1 hypothetical protein BDQ94DRAFT_83616 [Aspergillus welwitschiae]
MSSDGAEISIAAITMLNPVASPSGRTCVSLLVLPLGTICESLLQLLPPAEVTVRLQLSAQLYYK